MPLRPLLAFLSGLALGALVVGSVRFFSTEPSVLKPGSVLITQTTLPSPAAPAPASAALLVLPPLLTGSDADEALAAYLALPPLDPQASSPEIRERLGRLRALLTLLPPDSFTRLLEALALRDGSPESDLRHTAFEIWTEQDAPVAARWALAHVPRPGFDAAARVNYINQATLAWARFDFAAAYAWAGGIPDAKHPRDLQSRLLGQLAATDPRKALALAALGDADFVRAAQLSIFNTWAERDPVAAVKTLGPAILEHRKSDWRVQRALAQWIARDPAAALDWTLSQPAFSPDDPNRSTFLQIGWTLAQTPGALPPFLELVHRRPEISGHSTAVRNLLGSLIQHDVTAATTWLDNLSDVAERSDYITRALDYASQNPDAFLALAKRLPPSAERDEKIAAHVAAWAERDPDAALAWMENTRDPVLAAIAPRLEGLQISQLAARDPAAALARWQTLPDSARGPLAAASIAEQWGKNDPAAATSWLLAQLPSAPTDNSSFQAYAHLDNLAAAWVRRDFSSYLAWVQELPTGMQREYALQALTGSSTYHPHLPADPPPRAAFAEQLAQIADQSLRQRALNSHLRAWLQADVHAARAWIDSNDAISPEAAARLLSQVEALR